MSYMALYRKWRPGGFDDVKGQDHIVQTLKNQIVSDRVGHAYLFCGTRGTGKTTIAKIFAKSVNCEHPVDGSPCGECQSCRNITRGSSLNVVEIDAASNNGVENIRDIRDQVQYPPTEGKYRVYIIDEVHMLSTGAFNALLKTLEEPPSYVIFILATTEVHKIPITVLSRCQRYDFRRISIDTIADRIRELIAAEKIEVEDRALRYVAKAADGSMRDALSLLEQCVAFHFGQLLTYDHVLEVLGAVDNSVFSQLLRDILENRTVDCIHRLEEMVIQGRELGQFVNDFIWYLRNLLLIKTAEDAEDMLDLSTEHIEQLKEETKLIDSDTLMRFIRIFSELSNQLRYASQKRVLIELAIIKLTKPSMERDLDSVLQRLSQIENKLESGIPIQAAPADTASSQQSGGRQTLEATRTVVVTKAQLEDLNLVKGDWSNLIREMGGPIRSSLRDTKLELSGEDGLCIVFTDPNSHAIGSRQGTLEEMERYLAGKYGKEIRLKARLLDTGQTVNTVYVTEDDLKSIHMDVLIEE